MKRKTYWKDLLQSFTGSKGRFISILTLMMLGSLAVVGLKVASPNMEQTAWAYLKDTNAADMTVIADYGLDQADQTELQTLSGADVEFGYMTDLTLANSEDAIRIFSNTDKISKFQVTEGRLPEKEDELALADFWKDRYQIGQVIHLSQKKGSNSQLKRDSYTITGFIHSPDIFSKTDMGSSASGNGNLDAYGVVTEENFKSSVYTIARLRFASLTDVNPFSSDYEKKLEEEEETLKELVADNGQARLEKMKKDAQESLDEGKKQLDEAESNLLAGKKRLQEIETRLQAQENQVSQLPEPQKSQASSQLEEAKDQLKQEKEKLSQAETDLTNEKAKWQTSQDEVNALTEPTYHVYNRKSSPTGQGYLMYSNSAMSIRAVGNIFPVVLYAVAAMVTFTTMTRFVDEERTNAGIFKALGYHSKDIIAKFVIYGLVAGTLGTLLGILIGHYILAPTISHIITVRMIVGESQQYFYWTYSCLALGLSLVASVLPAYLVSRRELHEEAAQLLLPKPPVKGSKILLERITFIWSHLSFTQKVTARNIFRYKQRMLMTIFGVAGSVALLFAGLGIQSSVAGVADRQFKDLQQYQMILSVNSRASDSDKAKLEEKLQSDEVENYRLISSKQVEEKYAGKAGVQTVTMMVTDQDDLDPFVHLEKNGEKLSLSNGLVLTEKLAQLAGVSVGDNFTIDGKTFKVGAITEHYVGHFVYMNQATYEKIYGQAPKMNTYLVQLKDKSEGNTETVAGEFMDLAAVSSLVQNASTIQLFESFANSLNHTMAILVLVSVLLAIVILYNLTNINVAERIRELSTIKVLGFHNKEVTLYIYRETIILSLIGMIVGLVSGFYLHQFLIQMIAPGTFRFQPKVGWEVYLIPILAVSVILTILGFFVNHYLRKVDMLEALKSVE
ncbi:FtsX-like permease family protein [Streptococcus sp. BJSWXB6CM1]|uniref:FtsX-like permease family protein n=1 Tax=Streptococcus fermentans TaxID=3095082 RepID=A0ABU5FUU5_9STRE|nr:MULTISPECIES: FtsX-like permease family protein [unclassified Streptococcus]MDY4345112.1 FtsX-like permease family protein [Streptococcus sp. BJSWXB5TM5]MDY4360504.1 FtsX-like permease family protein [Streptococcus sp. BJSWXB3CM3]MDY4370637.1 FtsX-like permease family protein [Streptococcus sp. BJSWXB6CM1]